MKGFLRFVPAIVAVLALGSLLLRVDTLAFLGNVFKRTQPD
jgi:hypothetical protein